MSLEQLRDALSPRPQLVGSAGSVTYSSSDGGAYVVLFYLPGEENEERVGGPYRVRAVIYFAPGQREAGEYLLPVDRRGFRYSVVR